MWYNMDTDKNNYKKERVHLSSPNEKTEHGFLQVDNQILDLLLCDTKLNVYGILILAKIREYQRKKVKCFISNLTFSKMYKTSESMIKRQITELYELELIESIVALNDGARGKLRLLKIPRNFNKVLNKILQTKQYLNESFKGQNSTLNSILTLEAMDEDENFKGQFLGSNFDFEPRTDTTFKGQNQGSKPTTFKGHSDPITIDTNKSPINNRFLEGETGVLHPSTLAPSPTSSTDDFRNEPLAENSFVSVASNDALPNAHTGALSNSQSDTYSDTLEENDMARQRNQKNDEITEWFTTQVNPIKRYEYELKNPQTAKYYAWGNQCLAELQKDYYTPEEIFEWFSKEDKLWYLKKINWEHYNNPNWQWLIDASAEPIDNNPITVNEENI